MKRTLQQRHYEVFAAAIYRTRQRHMPWQGVFAHNFILAIADELKGTNPNYDYKKFIDACIKG